MSIKTGDDKLVAEFVDDARALVDAARIEAEQLDMLEPVTPEEMLEAREDLGPNAGRLAVVRHAREQKRKGRPPGSRNRRTDDFAKYLLQFGQHPAITMMQIQATPPELLIEASKQEKVHSFRKDGTPNVVVERMSYAEAQALRTRCAEGIMPYLESKKPVDANVKLEGDFNLIVPGMNISEGDANRIIAGEDILLGDWSDANEPE